MKPFKVTFYVYAEDEKEITQLQDQMNEFVRNNYNSGVLVTANKLSSALSKFCNNFFVTSYLR